jgi:hypothetical protein
VNPRKWSFCCSVDVKTGLMPRLGKKTRAGRIAPAAKNRTLHSRPPLYRFQEIFHAIKTGRYPNRTKLAETIEVTTKTIQRDIDYMRYQMSVPIEFDFARGGYYFTKPMTELAALPADGSGARFGLCGAEGIGSLQRYSFRTTASDGVSETASRFVPKTESSWGCLFHRLLDSVLMVFELKVTVLRSTRVDDLDGGFVKGCSLGSSHPAGSIQRIPPLLHFLTQRSLDAIRID